MAERNIKARANKIISILSKTYPRARIALEYKTDFELVAATILSAQSTDKQVNKITPALFKRFKTINDFAQADINELETMVHSTGFFRNKAKNIKAAAQEILERFGGKVPDNMNDLITLPGVARKTANVVLFNAFGKNEGIAVDTHVRRLSQRLGLTKNDDPNKIEIDLMAIFPKKLWGKITYYLIEHGRVVCDAKKPKCGICPVAKLCPSCRIYLSK
ncbi:MAG: endonuclease III [Candidatus Margulisiibacteriota bacterium]